MSVRMMTLVWELDLPDSEKLVLLALADCANDEGYCWPSIETLTKKCSKSERTVQNCVRTLCVRGHLTQKPGAHKSYDYLVHPIVRFATPAKSAPRKVCTPQSLHPTPAEVAPPPPQPLHPNHKENHQEPSDDSASDDAPSLRPEHVFEHYQELAQRIARPVPRDLTPERRQLTKARIAQYPLEDFQTVFAKCRDSPFLRGDNGRTPLTFDWIMKKGNFQKTLEGNYDR